MQLKFKRPAVVESLANLPGLSRPVLGTYDAWLRFKCGRQLGWQNSRARAEFNHKKPVLTPVQDRVLANLRDCGMATVTFQELLGDATWWSRLRGEVNQWLSSPTVQEAERRYREESHKTAHFKEHLVQWYEKGAKVAWNSPWLQLGLHDKLLGIVDHYLGMYARLHHVNLWNTIALEHDGPSVGPQCWHRDPDDVRLVKVFLYFNDVNVDNGAMEYVPHSRRGEKYGDLWQQDVPFDGARPPEDEFEKLVPRTDWVTCAFPTGTFLFADTTGFHRGGRAANRNRVVGTWAFSSPAALWPVKFELDYATLPRDLSTATRYALSSYAKAA